MALKRSDIKILAVETAKWCIQNGYEKEGDAEHGYFSVSEWCECFGHTEYIFGKVKQAMIEIGITIAVRNRCGHYISDAPQDTASNLINQAKNIITRVETLAALQGSAKKSRHYKAVIERLKDAVNGLDWDENDSWTIGPKLLTE